MNEVNQNKPATIRGELTDIRSVPTQTGTAFVVCKVGGHDCKVFGDLAKLVLANQNRYEGQETEASGHWDARRGSEFVIEGFGKQSAKSSPKLVSDIRPEKPAMRVEDSYVVIRIPRGATPEQRNRVVDVAKEALRGLETQQAPGLWEMANAYITSTDPADETGDIPF